MSQFWKDGYKTLKFLVRTILLIVFALGGYITAVDSTDYNAGNSMFLWIAPPAYGTSEMFVGDLTFDWPRIYRDGQLIGYSLMCHRSELIFYSMEEGNKGLRVAHCAKFQGRDKKWWI